MNLINPECHRQDHRTAFYGAINTHWTQCREQLFHTFRYSPHHTKIAPNFHDNNKRLQFALSVGLYTINLCIVSNVMGFRKMITQTSHILKYCRKNLSTT